MNVCPAMEKTESNTAFIHQANGTPLAMSCKGALRGILEPGLWESFPS